MRWNYSVRWNSATAIPSSAAPVTAMMPSDTPTGTVRPFHVTAGDRGSARDGRDAQVVEDCEPHRVNDAGDRIGPGEHAQPRGQRPQRAERAVQEEQRDDEHLRQRHERLYLPYPCCHHYAEGGQREGQQQ